MRACVLPIFVLSLLFSGCGKFADKQADKSSEPSAAEKNGLVETDAAAQPGNVLKQLVALLEIERSARMNLERMADSMKQALPDVPEEFWTRFLAEADTKAYVEMAYQVYPKYLTKDDMKCLVAFHGSPLGKKMKRENEAAAQEIHNISLEWGKNVGTLVRAMLNGEQVEFPRPKKSTSPQADDIREMIIISGTGQLASMMFDKMLENLKPLRSDLPEEVWAAFRKELRVDDLMELIVPVMEKHYAPADVQGIIAFYKSDCGKKINLVQDQISAEMMTLGQIWGAKLGAEIEQKLKAEQQQ